jgi:hypothetical protein
MYKSLRIQPVKRGKQFVPALEEQLRIIGGLLKLHHFDGIWCNQGTLTVRRFRDHFEVPQYLPWDQAAAMLKTAEALPRPKPPAFERPELSIVVAKQEVG